MPQPSDPTTKTPSPNPFFSSFVAAVTGRGSESKQFPWPVTLVVVLISAVFGAVFWARMVFVNQRAAKLASELRKAQNRQEQAHGDACMEANEKRRSQLAAKAKKQKLLAEHLEYKVAKRLAQKHKYSEQLKKVASWDDLVVVDKRGTDG